MFQFGEILALAIWVVAVVYVATNWRRLGSLPHLRMLLGPTALLAAGTAATVLEGLFFTGADLPWLVVTQDSVVVIDTGAPGARVVNLLEHACMAASCVWLLVGLARIRRMGGETPA